MSREFGEKRPDFREQNTPTLLYRDLLIRATLHDKNLAIGDNVTAIDFSGPFADTADKLNRLTQADPQKRECGTVVYITPNQRVLIRNEVTWGDEKFVDVNSEINYEVNQVLFYKRRKQDRFVGLVMHSHPVDAPPSPLDLSDLLLTKKDLHARTSEFIVTPARKILVFRGSQTPQLSRKEIAAKIQLWENLVKARTDELTTGRIDEWQIAEIENKAWLDMTKSIIKRYGLRYFVSPNDQIIARRTLLKDL